MRTLGSPILFVVSTLLAVTLAEVALRALAPVTDPYWDWRTRTSYIPSQFPPNLRFVTEAEKGLPGVEGRNLFTTDNLGFRHEPLAVPKPETEYRVFMIGGSTTECLYLDDKDAIHSVLQRELQRYVTEGMNVRVYNGGKSGDRSDDHLSLLVHRVVHLQPDLVVVFAGVNDLIAMIAGFDYLHYNVREELSLPRLFRLGATNFQLGRRLYYLLERTRPRNERETFQALPSRSNYRMLAARRRSAPIVPDDVHLDLSGYAKNLVTLAGVAHEHGFRLVFMTQQSTWNSKVDSHVGEWQWMLYVNGQARLADVMDRALSEVNAVTRKVGREHAVPIYDLADSLPKSLEYFYDDVHFNTRGAQVAGTQLAAMIATSSILPRALIRARTRPVTRGAVRD